MSGRAEMKRIFAPLTKARTWSASLHLLLDMPLGIAWFVIAIVGLSSNALRPSNFVGFFRLLREMIEQRLQVALATMEGGADACLYLGPKITHQFVAELYFGRNSYTFSLVPTPDNRLIFSEETILYYSDIIVSRESLGSGYPETKLKERKDDRGSEGTPHDVGHYVYDAISSWVVYHFHDTSLTASMRRPRH